MEKTRFGIGHELAETRRFSIPELNIDEMPRLSAATLTQPPEPTRFFYFYILNSRAVVTRAAHVKITHVHMRYHGFATGPCWRCAGNRCPLQCCPTPRGPPPDPVRMKNGAGEPCSPPTRHLRADLSGTRPAPLHIHTPPIPGPPGSGLVGWRWEAVLDANLSLKETKTKKEIGY